MGNLEEYREAAPGSHAAMRRAKRAAKVAVFATLAYGNVAVITSPAPLRPNGWPALPVPALLRDLFMMPGMFGGGSPLNHDFILEARIDGNYVRLPLRDYFPDRLGVTFTQFYLVRHQQMLGDAERQRAADARAQRIAARYRLLHPGHDVDRVRMRVERWPKHPRGYRAGKTKQNTMTQQLFDVGTP